MTTPISLSVGTDTWQLQLRPETVVELRRQPVSPPAGGPRELVLAALEQPFGFEAPLRRAITPDDRVTIVLDERLPHVADLLSGVIEHLGSAGIAPTAITVLVPHGGGRAGWVDELPDEFADIKLEVHDPEDRQKISYLATTKAGRRVYLNRTLVESDCVIVLTGRRYDPTFAYAGAEVALFPVLADPESLVEFVGRFTTDPPGEKLPATRREPAEVGKLLSPFYLHVIEGAGDTIQAVLLGLSDSTAEGVRRQNARWRGTVEDRPDLVVAAVAGAPERTDFHALAAAVACAARVVQPDGRIVLLTTAAPPLEEGAELLRRAGDPDKVDRLLQKRKPDDWPAAALWAFAARQASLFVASRWAEDVTEELFATPVASAAEVQRLIDAAERVLIIPDANKTMVEIA
ncbi:lactate racemase domain-containing protein [Fimbriiglobus ruber]|uniref:LarA-like N-terminal domain-containing protein n=1 Tax=Fimbriiglobus ruber TaxID=1908690 RepID=A0A225CZE5_9BACT|nr:lactate racemase domain-containing protein [Fimbriiglobus ruber]OWK34740.1 hypothetical protein FRUB_09582 [Fimbriiglobus ruber]